MGKIENKLTPLESFGQAAISLSIFVGYLFFIEYYWKIFITYYYQVQPPTIATIFGVSTILTITCKGIPVKEKEWVLEEKLKIIFLLIFLAIVAFLIDFFRG